MGKNAVTSALSENDEFIRRLKTCVKKEKSSRAFANKAGLAASTLHGYLKGVEPTRITLIQLAHAAGVSVSWLAVGSEESTADVKLTSAVWFGLARDLAAKSGASDSVILHIQDSDNMEPSIGFGDMLIIDQNKNGPEEGIVLMDTPRGRMMCRIVHYPDGRVMVSCDNPYMKAAVTRFEADTMKVIGRPVLCVSNLRVRTSSV